MGKTALLLGSFLWVSCQPQQHFHPTKVVLESDCPKQVVCDIKLLPGKSMVVANDGAQTTYTLENSADKNVVIYKYDKIVKGNVQDAAYREEIVFELEENSTVVNLTGNQLQNTKMLFGRFCYCKGQTGYYAVNKGTLSIGSDLSGNLDFTVSEVPQVTKKIVFSLK